MDLLSNVRTNSICLNSGTRTWGSRRRGQVIADELAVRIQVLQVFDLEFSGNRHCVLHLRQLQIVADRHVKERVRNSLPAPQHGNALFLPCRRVGANNNNVFSRCCKASEYASG
jgi:hypothetical protein